jgi:hypothetical protein
MTRAITLNFLLVFSFLCGCGKTCAADDRPVTQRQRTLRALNSFFPEIKFQKASLTQVVDFLSDKAGVNIIIDPAVYSPAGQDWTRGTLPPFTEEPRPDTAPPAGVEHKRGEMGGSGAAPGDVGGITLRLKNVPLKVVLKYVLRYKNLQYIVDDYAILIVPIGRAIPEQLSTEVFRLRTGSFAVTRPVRQGPARPF